MTVAGAGGGRRPDGKCRASGGDMVAILISKPRLLMELSIEKLINSSNLCGAPEEIRTPDPQIRSSLPGP
jgi:hypothetical protein